MPDAKARVLIVDDDEVLCRALETRLAWAGYLTASATTGRRAIVECATRPPEVIILDVALPDIDGYQVCKTVRDELANERTAVIFLTGTSQVGIGDMSGFLDRVGGHFLLRKPHDTQSLIGLLDSITGYVPSRPQEYLLPLSLN